MSIPKIIHYCWLSNDPFPADIRQWMATWKAVLPDYELMLWDLKRFPLEKSAWVREAFEHRKYAFAADYIRLYALYEYGGIYLDSDVEVVRPFGELLERPLLLGFERNGNIEGGVIGAEPHSPCIKACLDHYQDRHFVREDGTLDTVTLPHILTECLREYNIDRSQILPWDYLTACSPHIQPQVTENTRSIHHFYGSWLESFRRDEKFRFGSFRIVKVKKRQKRVDFTSPDYPMMFQPNESVLCTLLATKWKRFVLLRVKD